MKYYRYFHYLSLDIVMGALATSCLASKILSSAPGWAWWVGLSCTVWLLYTGDHLLDAFRHRKQNIREMHLYLFRHRRSLLWTMGLVAIGDVALVLNLLDRTLLKAALFLGLLVLMFYAMRHLLRRNRLFFVPGEIFVLLLYLTGTWLGPFVARSVPFQSGQVLILVMMAGVLMMNLGIISLYDVRLDTRMGISSMAMLLGKKVTRNLMIATSAGIFILAILQFLVYGTDSTFSLALILSGMAALLLMVLLFPSRFRKEEAYRLVADGVLLMGFLSLMVSFRGP